MGKDYIDRLKREIKWLREEKEFLTRVIINREKTIKELKEKQN